MERICTKCLVPKEATSENFWARSNGQLVSECKNCGRDRHKREYEAKKAHRRAKHKAWSDRNKNQHAHLQRQYQLKGYGITEAEYDQMVIDQNNKCAICHKPEIRMLRGQPMRLAIDHNHDTGQVRRLLCNNCNTTLGMVKDNIEILESAIAYLKKYAVGQLTATDIVL